MKRHLEAFRSALALLTILPGGRYSFDKNLSGLSSAYYPLVGFILGAILFLIQPILLVYFEQLHVNIILFALLIVLYGGLHFDGLSDTIDGLFVQKERALDVMKDPHAGTMGLLFSFLGLILTLAAFAQIKDMSLVIAVLMMSRFFATFFLFRCDYISQNGIATKIKDEINKTHIIVPFIGLVAMSILFNISLLIVLLFGFLMAQSVARFFKHRYGGINGDILGAIILLSELIMFHAVLLI